MTAFKFEVWLVGNNAEHYCIGFIKGSETDCNRAKRTYNDGTVWWLSRVSLDTHTAAAYISTPIRYRVDLLKSKMILWDPKHPVPPHTVAEVSSITTNRSTDLIGLIKEVSTEKRKGKSEEETPMSSCWRTP